MKSKIAICIALSGWILSSSYIFCEYINFSSEWINNFFHPRHAGQFLSHVLIVFIPLISTFSGYLLNEREKSLGKIRVSQENYFDFFQNASDGYYSADSLGTILEVNDAWLKMLGYDRDEVIGRMKITQLLTDEGFSTFDRLKGHINNLPFDLRKKDGALNSVMLNTTNIFDEKGNFLRSLAIARDNCEEKKQLIQIRRAAQEWSDTFDSVPFGIMLLDLDCNIIRANSYIATNWQASFNEIVHKKCYDIIHGQGGQAKNCPLLKSANRSKPEPLEVYNERLGKYFMTYVNPIVNEENLTVAYVHSLIDVTEDKDKAKKLLDSRNAFFNMLRDMDSAFKELKELYQSLIKAFANSIDAKSQWTRGHSERVAEYAIAIAEKMGISKQDLDTIRTAALLHDIGKIGVYDVILDKPGKLTAEEYALVKMHPSIGELILKPIKGFEHIVSLIRSHHENIDGTGYPDGLKGEEIPMISKIIRVADAFDSMSADRPYRISLGRSYAFSELRRCSGRQFDHEVVQAFLKVLERKGEEQNSSSIQIAQKIA